MDKLWVWDPLEKILLKVSSTFFPYSEYVKLKEKDFLEQGFEVANGEMDVGRPFLLGHELMQQLLMAYYI